MSIKIDLGIHERALQVQTKRAELIANNIANSDTPGYKARDLDFREVLSSAQGESRGARTTDSRHLSGLIEADALEGLKFRLPSQPSIDGNTVDGNVEKAEYARNALQFQASFQFLNSKIKGILGAIRGE